MPFSALVATFLWCLTESAIPTCPTTLRLVVLPANLSLNMHCYSLYLHDISLQHPWMFLMGYLRSCRMSTVSFGCWKWVEPAQSCSETAGVGGEVCGTDAGWRWRGHWLQVLLARFQNMFGAWVQVDIPEKVLSQILKNQLFPIPAFSLSIIPVHWAFSFRKWMWRVSSVIPKQLA